MYSFSLSTLVMLMSSLLFTLINADEHGVTFLYPSSTGISVNYLDTINVTYLSPFPTPKLYTFCRNSTKPDILLQKQVANVPAFNASQLVQLQWPNMASCYFDLRPNSSAGYGANSFSIKINNTARATPITFGLNQPATSTSVATASPTLNISNSSTSAPGNVNANISNSSRGKDIGIGVGGAVAAFALIGLAIFLFRQRAAGRKARGAAIPDDDSQTDSGSPSNNQKGVWQQRTQEIQLKELKPQELPSPEPEPHMLPTYENVSLQHPNAHEMPANTTFEMSADSGTLNPSSEIRNAVAVKTSDKQANRFSWTGRESWEGRALDSA